MNKTLAAWFPGTLAVVGTLALWELACRAGAINPTLLPAPSVVTEGVWGILRANTMWKPLGHTLALMFGGYLIACVLGISLGIAMGRSDAVYRLFEPLVELVRPIPKPALIPPLFLFLGLGVNTMLVIVVLGSFFPVLINTVQGVRGVDPTLIDTARTYRLGRFAVVRKIVLPAALPMIATGMRVSLGLALTLVIVAEMLVGENGIGYLILDMQRSFQTRQMYAWLVLLAVIGVVLNAGFERAERLAMPWRGK